MSLIKSSGITREFQNTNLDFSVCSTTFYSKDIAFGPIIPFIPASKRIVETERWLAFKNSHETYDLILDADFCEAGCIEQVLVCDMRYPENSGCPRLIDFGSEGIKISPKSQLWIKIPDTDDLTIKLKSNGVYHTYKLIKSSGYSLWMVTV